ncbi:helix-turn-helix domain-containing protein [Alicyclobacillus mengziensis]|uniref:Helix-turn-helix transcriptional regulator n=1 Tax=Alicyclobacillus mengziensis TaxID=2931921 RepID=A0A9X7Z8J4_9BACL|nr:helix-turn-helix transcriptional regulator [Alicyclobacillus mengziensis]QSO48470.1 helix-turn-helix transcriptional regulator [Alicyclobacillus mengziensis]
METGLYKIIGQRLRELREQKQFTQGDLSVRVNLTRASVANIELGKQKIQIDTLYRFAEVLESTPHEILPKIGELSLNGDYGVESLIDKRKYSEDQIEWVKRIIIKGKINEGEK